MKKPCQTLVTITTNTFVLISLFGATGSISAQTAIVPLPEDSSISCEESIDRVKAELSRKGFFVPLNSYPEKLEPFVKIDKNNIPQYYYDYPKDRTETVIFGLGEVTNLHSSPKFMATLAAQIMAECNSVGLITFAWLFEGGINVGYFPDRTVQIFTWIDLDLDDKEHLKVIETAKGQQVLYRWGYYYSP